MKKVVERHRPINAGGIELSYWETLLVILRRWLISVPAVLISAGIGVGAFYAVPPSYEDTVQVLFLGSPNQPGEKAKVNPYLSLSSTLVQTAAVVQARLSTAQTVESLAAQGATAEYLVVPDQSTPAPVLILTTTSADPAVAETTSQAVIAEIQQVLIELQTSAGAPADTWVHSSVISTLPEPKRVLNASIRPAITAAGGFFILTMFMLFLFEGRQQRRRKPEPSATPDTQPIPKPVIPPISSRFSERPLPATLLPARQVPRLLPTGKPGKSNAP